MTELTAPINFKDVAWATIPACAGAYVIYEGAQVIYVGMSGRNGKSGRRSRLRDHSSGQIVNMFAQYLFLARIQFIPAERTTLPRDAKLACREYILNRCSFRYAIAATAAEARMLD